MTTGLVWGGSALAVLGIAMLGWCIWRALMNRKMEDNDAAKSQLQTLAAINMAAVGIAAIGLGCVVVGFIL